MSEVAVYCLWEGGGDFAKDTAVLPAELRDDEGSDPKRRKVCVEPPLYWETPLTCCSKLSRKLGAKVWLKLDNLQPPQSYKIRGIGYLCQMSAAEGCTHFYSSSGGNAGLAAAYCGRQLKIPVTVIVPETTPCITRDKLAEYGAEVRVHGKCWDDADQLTRELASDNPSSTYISPFEHPDIWEGHSSVVSELHKQLNGVRPDVMVVCVGGGGLLCGIVKGLHRVGWGGVPVVAMETKGADSLAECARTDSWAKLSSITSIAKTLGALRVTKKAYELLHSYPVISVVVSDREAVAGCLNFADDHKMLVEPSCGATLAAVYGNTLQTLQDKGLLPQKMENIVALVCGGSGVNLDMLAQWKKDFDL